MKIAETVPLKAPTLPEDERVSLEAGPEFDVETTWHQEVAARVAALKAGEVTTTPWEEIRERFRARLSERRQG